MSDTETIYISVVLPVYNEEDNIIPLFDELQPVLNSIARPYQVIFINDGSEDSTLDKLKELKQRDHNIDIIDFRRNFGQTAAMSAGLDHAKGDVVITMDADRQNDPADIPKMLKEIDEGYDLVCGWRHQRQDGFLLRRLPSILANKLISSTTDVRLHDYGCTLKAFRHEVAKGIRLYGEMHRFIPAIASWMGVRISEIKVNHRPRVAGTSKYGISRTFRVILDLITVKFLLSYSSRPLQFFGWFGFISGGAGFILGAYLTIQKLFFDTSLANRPMLLLSVLLIFMGLQFVTVGLLAEMHTRTYHEAQNKPTYVIREII